MAANTLRKRKIAVLGSRSVGKSSLVIQFIENHFVDAYYPTIENTFSKGVAYKGVEYDCDIIDTAGQDEYSILSSKHAIGIHGYVLVYSVASRRSFDMIKIVYDKIVDFCGKNDIPCVIVGAKTDLQSSPNSRQVAPNEGEELAKLNNAAWVETSAKNNVNVGKVFELCLAEIEKRSPSSKTDQPEASRCLIM
ncbi:small GTPase superfamily [Suillus subaureus]|uniref:Small GTPase superfamily n=1 Tax=Suillus subaureus TaxID=48587 RepID=A0A9P7JFT6_9AGAM|nr:small GTPase superfamily [Suillus subaureus]KAG1820232.1 small GTPase superfamily [Suillus subaureus]